MTDSSPTSPAIKLRKKKADNTRPIRDEYEYERRWPRRRGRYEIETQCTSCQWWFDSFDPDAKKCHICVTPPPPLVETTKAPSTQIPVSTSTVQENEAPQTAPNPFPAMGTQLGTTQLEWGIPAYEAGDSSTQYQTYPQEFGASFGHPYSPGIASSSLGGYSPNQLWGQDYGMLPFSLNELCGQEYNMSHNPASDSTTSPNSSVFIPNQMMTQEYNTPSIQSINFEQGHSHPPDNMPNQTQGEGYVQPRDTLGLGNAMPSQEEIGEASSNTSNTTTSYVRPLRPLRPLLPRELPADDMASSTNVQPYKGDDMARSGSKDANRRHQRSKKHTSVETGNKRLLKPKDTDYKRGEK
ncbi:hypothetical protein F5B22DRAFT_658280 [Xylaria bambusicola]|uniref:uncharacterized protein n=1 Tax=Xylaria bambusicola TaxID=326684 RepID=UPI002007CB45|nr:uncharacterized protein F5B22DRAFT_658280 [Xylaria bambusicola]KAI0525436.1 hypothetical protein F5B22DRAFT_658280 [Xylaria bambusicola]